MKLTCTSEISLPAITFYNEQITKISKDIYPKDHLTKQVIQAKHFIDNHFADSISLGGIAGKAFLSKFHFIQLFKSFYGRTPLSIPGLSEN